MENRQRVATFSLSEEIVKKLEQILIHEIIDTGKAMSKSEILRNLISEKYKKVFKSKNTSVK